MSQQAIMSQTAELKVAKDASGLIVSGAIVNDSQDAWQARIIADRRILLCEQNADLATIGATSISSCEIEIFKDFLIGLAASAWSGVVLVDTGVGIKKIYFDHGRVVFAASNIIDDRLGEVIYREAKITLDELANATSQVTKQRKFGQVLVGNGVFSNVQLWNALKLQVLQILRSCFMTDRVYFEIIPGATLAPTEVVFTESCSDLIGECFSFGCAFRGFLSRLRAETSVVTIAPIDVHSEGHAAGTFIGDFLTMVGAQRNLQDLLDASKLTDHYTIAALLALVNSGIVAISPDIELDKSMLLSSSGVFSPLKTRMDAYAYLLGRIRKSFEEAARPFPTNELARFALGLNPDGFPSLFLDPSANLSKDSITGILSQCASNTARVSYFAIRIDSLIQFLLQVAGDNLEPEIAKKIRNDYRAITA